MRRFLYRVEAITAAAVKTTNVAVAPDGHRAMFVGRAPNAEEWCLTNIAEADTTESVEDGLRLYTTKITVTTHAHNNGGTATHRRRGDTLVSGWEGTDRPALHHRAASPG